MKQYADVGGNSGVSAYDILANGIIVEFKTGRTYLYDDARPGTAHVEQMKQLAQEGKGLNTYISRYVRQNFAQEL